MHLHLLSGPAMEPVSLDEAKQWLRLEGNAEDELLQALIVSARLTIESYTRRSLITQSWRMVLDGWPQSPVNAAIPVVAIPFAPFQRVAAIRVFDATDVPHSVPMDSFRAPRSEDRAKLRFLLPPLSPGRPVDGIEIDLIVGYGDNPADVPPPLRRAILMLIAFWHENRGDAQRSEISVSMQAKAIAAPYRRERIV